MADPVVAPAAVVAPAPGTPEHDAAMAAKVDANAAAAAAAAANAAPAVAPAAQRPQWLPEKFKTAEDFAAAYKALESKLGTPAATAPAAPATDPKTVAPGDALKITDPAAATAAVADAGLDMAALQEEWQAAGDLKPETYEKLAKSGIPKPMVDAYVAGQKALAADYNNAAFTAAGGQEEYGKLTAWAKTGLTDGEKAAFNTQVTSGDKSAMQFAIAGLKARMGSATGNLPATTLGGTSAAAGDVYGSMAQVTADMRNPLYKTDSAFRAQVMSKLDRSNIGAIHNRA